MQLSLVKEYFTYRSSYRAKETAKELTTAIAESSVKEVRKAIKELTGKVCPTIVFLPIERLYFFKKDCKQVFYNLEVVYCLLETLKGYYNYNLTYYGNSPDGLAILETPGSSKQYQANNGDYWPITIWTFYGEECDKCGALFIKTQRRNKCPVCEAKYKIRTYNHKVEDELGFEKTKEIRYGIELEYENVTAQDVFDTLENHALPKSDGSIYNGVEIVTKPASLSTHKKKLTNFYENVKVSKASNTGMHVHIERAKLSEYQIGFIQEFLNKTELIRLNEKVAGRNYSSNTYCRTKAGIKLTTGITYDFEVKKLVRTESGKYSALNTGKPNTVEIRIFSSPETEEECFAKLDFVSALVQFSSPYSVHVKNLKDKFSWVELHKFILNNKKEFKDFYNYFIKSNRLEVKA